MPRDRKGTPGCSKCARPLDVAFARCGVCDGKGSTKGTIGFKRRCATCAGKGQVLFYNCPIHPGLVCWRCLGSGSVDEFGMEAPCPFCRAAEYQRWKLKFTAPPGYVPGQPPFGARNPFGP